MSLLSKAKLINTVRTSSKSEAAPELIELAIAYVKHEVSLRQASSVLGLKGTNKAANRLTQAIYSAIRIGKLK